MKKLSEKVHRLSQRAAELRQVAEALPAKAAELRQSVATTVGQARQIRSDLAAGITTGVSTLRPVAGGGELASTLSEIEAAAETLAEAGHELAGVDVEPGLGGMGRRVLVRLKRVDEIETAELRRLLAAQKDHPVTKSLLSALVQASETAEGVEFEALDFAEVVADVGTGQALRISWRAESATAPARIPTTHPSLATTTAASEPRPPVFSQSSYFTRPSATAGAGASNASAGSVHSPTTATSPAPGSGSATPPRETAAKPGSISGSASISPTRDPNWRASALDRFKKMPDLTKRPAS